MTEQALRPVKRCPACGRTLPLDDFGTVTKRHDGRAAKCRDCERERQRNLYRGHSRRDPAFQELLKLAADPVIWMRQAACAAPDISADLFFAEGRGSDVNVYTEAKRLCHSCPVREECLTYAFRHSIQDGVWGGMSPRERRKEARRRRLKVA